MSDEIQVTFEFHGFRFALLDAKQHVLASGLLRTGSVEGAFSVRLEARDAGHWALRPVEASHTIAGLLTHRDVLQGLANHARQLLRTTNMWSPDGQQGDGTRLLLNQYLAPPEATDRVFASFRAEMLTLPSSDWSDLWPLIDGRLDGDAFFRVQGFSTAQVKGATARLRQIFDADWVHARYRKALRERAHLRFAADLPSEANAWFPAYHLARTALGALCVDPGWNYLVEIGLSIEDLQGFGGLEQLKRQLARSPGTQHHLCLAAELHRRGYLRDLEPPTGSGSASSDLLVEIDGRPYEIEVKEFSSKEPTKRLAEQLKRKNDRLPKAPRRPIVFHAVLIEDGVLDKQREDTFFDEVRALRDAIPSKISAIVAGERFIDGLGGRVKRDAECRIINPSALVPAAEDHLATLFARNYDRITYPIFGLDSFFAFYLTTAGQK